MSRIRVLPLLKKTAAEWSEDKATKMAASLAYYTATSIAPMAVAAVGIGTLVARKHFKPEQIQKSIASLTNEDMGKVVAEVINKPASGHAGLIASIIGIIIAVFSASAVFGELQDSLNTIWEVRPKPNRGVMGMVHDRFLTLTMVLGIAFLLLVSTVLTSLVTGLSGAVFGRVFGDASVAKPLVGVILFFLTTGVVTVLFAAMFKLLPDVLVSWRDVWLGGFLTAVAFQIGKLGLSLYVAKASPGSAFGAFGTIVVMLVWVYYSAQILFFGAEFTQVFANQYGSHVAPAANAEPLTEDMRRQAGMPHAPGSASHPDKQTRPRRPAPDLPRRRPPVAPRPSSAGKGVVLAGLPIVTGVVLGRFAWLRYKAGRVHKEQIQAGWAEAARKWKRLGKLFVSKSADRFAMTHGPKGRAGPTWSDLSHGDVRQP